MGRDFVLDVKLRSSQVRAVRARMAAVALAAVFASVAGLYGAWRAGEFALNRLVYENPAFVLQEIDAQTDGAIAPSHLCRWARVRVGENLMAMDLARVKRDLEMVSVVQSASIERILPNRLRIRVIEREPLAQVNLVRPRAGGGVEMGVYYVDAEGFLMLPLEPQQRASQASQPPERLPLILGLNGNELQVGRRIESPQAQAALRLLQAFENSPMAGLVDLQRIDVGSTGVLTITTENGAEVTFSLQDPERQLLRWQEIFREGQKLNKALATLDLAVSNSIPATWLEASAVPASTPKALKPVRPKKKHV